MSEYPKPHYDEDGTCPCPDHVAQRGESSATVSRMIEEAEATTQAINLISPATHLERIQAMMVVTFTNGGGVAKLARCCPNPDPVMSNRLVEYGEASKQLRCENCDTVYGEIAWKR